MHNDVIALGMCTNVYFPGEISPFLAKEIGIFWSLKKIKL
jgi:hypothetical protein